MKVTTDACLFGAFVASIEGRVTSEERTMKVLDIGTGTGVLALMFAQKNTDAVIDAVELDEHAAQHAKENVEASAWRDRINVIHGDIRKIVKGPPGYDIIISNPPFHENQLSSSDAGRNKAHHSSDLLLDELFQIINAVLKPSGKFYLLLPYYRLEEVNRIIANAGLKISMLVRARQSIKHDYFRIMIEGTSSAANTIEKEICIWNDKEEYTSKFIELLKEYYLYL
jgi:tRNA1Val (adenine37-N6)-methyltransferase